VSDNGTAFTTQEFAEFAKKNGIRHVKVAPCHPSSNGLAEKAVGNVESFDCRIARLLFQYRITPHSRCLISRIVI